MKVFLEEKMELTTRTLHVKDGPTIKSDKLGGKAPEFQVKVIQVRHSSLSGRTIVVSGNAKSGGVDVAVKKTFYPGKDLPRWLVKVVG